MLSRWWIIAIAIALSLLIGFIYLTAAKATYTAYAVLVMEQDGTSALPPDEYLASQRELIDAANRNDAALTVRADKGEGTITLSLDADSPAIATTRLAGIIDGYLKAAEQQHAKTSAGWKDLAAERDKLAADRADKERALIAFKQTTNVTGTEADQAAGARLKQLQAALTAAQVEAAGAKAAADAAEAMLQKPEQLRDLIAANRSTGAFDALDQQKGQLQAELDALEPQLQRQKETLLPQHPVLAQTQRKIDQIKQRLSNLDAQYAQTYRTWLAQQQLAAQKKVEELTELVDAQAKEAKDYTANLLRHSELEADLKSADAALADADRKLGDATAAGVTAASAMKVVQPPRAPDRPSHPRPANVMLLAGAIGIIAGAALALLTARAR